MILIEVKSVVRKWGTKMKFSIKHEIKGRIRVHLHQTRMSFEQADTLLYYLTNNQYVTNAKVFERTCDAIVYFVGCVEKICL